MTAPWWSPGRRERPGTPRQTQTLRAPKPRGRRGDEGALTEMSSLCPLWDDMLPLDAVSLKTKQARPLSGFALREAVPHVDSDF